MNNETILALLKAQLGISTYVRDAILIATIEGVVTELETEKGIQLDTNNPQHTMFVVDYSLWKYKRTDPKYASVPMPLYLQRELNNLMVGPGGEDLDI